MPPLLALVLAGCCAGGSGTPAPPMAPVAPAAAPVPSPVGEARSPTAVGAPGTAVLADWHALGLYYLGVVVARDGERATILFEDGTSDSMPAGGLLEDRLGPGVRVEAMQYGDEEFVPGRLARRVGHAGAIDYEDGRHLWTSMGLVRVAPREIPVVGTAVPVIPPTALGQPGSAVLARYSGDGRYYAGVVAELTESGVPLVVYADGSGEERALTDLRVDDLGPGTVVEARDPYLTGTVTRRVAHAIEIRTADGALHWAALATVRVGAGAADADEDEDEDEGEGEDEE